jgi:hypothetical protein
VLAFALQIIVKTPVGRLEIITNLIGRHNVYNILAAVAVGCLLNLPLADIGAGIEAVQVIPGRCEVVNNVLDLPLEGEDAEGLQQQPNLPRNFPVVVDAADTPQRLAAVLESLRQAGAERIFTVFGCDGVVSCCAYCMHSTYILHLQAYVLHTCHDGLLLMLPEHLWKQRVSLQSWGQCMDSMSVVLLCIAA